MVYRGRTAHGYLNKHHLSLSSPLWIYGLMKLKNSCPSQLPTTGQIWRWLVCQDLSALPRRISNVQSGGTDGKLRPDSWREIRRWGWAEGCTETLICNRFTLRAKTQTELRNGGECVAFMHHCSMTAQPEEKSLLDTNLSSASGWSVLEDISVV